MKSSTLVIKDLAINNGIVAQKPSWMSTVYWLMYEVPRIGKTYTKDKSFLYGTEYDIDKEQTIRKDVDITKLMQEDGECLSCKI